MAKASTESVSLSSRTATPLLAKLSLLIPRKSCRDLFESFLLTCLLDNVWILQREITCHSLLGVNGQGYNIIMHCTQKLGMYINHRLGWICIQIM